MKEMTDVKTISIFKYAALDVALVGLACLIPTMSHLFAVPLYKANPMLLLLLTGMLMSRDWKNTLLLAVAMPLASSLLTGMPAAGKVVCMMAELAMVALVFNELKDKMHTLAAVLLAIVSAKMVYYALKAIVVAPAVLVGTEWWMQLASVVLWGGLFAMVYKRVR